MSLTNISALQALDLSNNRLTGEVPANGSFVPPPPVSTQDKLNLGMYDLDSAQLLAQGSAADIIKIAMINVHSVIVNGHGAQDLNAAWLTELSVLQGHCRILLQVCYV
ncbi:hypothetical protein MRB53_006465 [Persea americana]|uniref:Uncharacterized protein n=1 Tax=Persea americana TaxID=3435 RepID=A0ACC2MHS9_PERAE|nr:hypothetical protein MRB53_006465 [Persea americana]